MTTQQATDVNLRLVAGRLRAVDWQPYLASALFAMKPIREPRIPTAGVDEQWRMYWNPEFIATCSVDEVAAVWLHEVGHLLRDHRARFNALMEPKNRHPLFNKAADAAINVDLRDCNIHLPPIKAIYPEIIPGAEAGMSAEQMYRLILDTPEAEKVTQQKENMVLLPGAILVGKVQGQKVIGITRVGFLDGNDLTITAHLHDGGLLGPDLTAPGATISHTTAHDRRTLSFVIDDELEAGDYVVSVTSAGTTVQAALKVVSPHIRTRPDHLATGWSAPQKITVMGDYTDFTAYATATLTDESGNDMGVSVTERVSKRYLNFDITEQVPDGLYTVTVTDGEQVLTSPLPIGLPFMDISPSSLPEGHGTPYPFAAVVDDFIFTPDTTFTLMVATMSGYEVYPGDAIDTVVVKSDTACNFMLTVALPKGQYVVVANTANGQVSASLTVGGNGEGDGGDEGEEGDDGSGDSDGDSDNEGKGGNGKGDSDSESDSEGDDDSEGEGEGEGKGGKGKGGSGSGGGDFDDCGSGAGGPDREWERGSDTSDGAVSPGTGNLIRNQVAREIAEASKGRGDVAGGWTRWAQTILKPQVDWRKELRSVVRRTMATVSGMKDYTYSRPSRRGGAVPNVILPALRAPRPAVVAAVVDTSGSVSDKMLGQALGDMKALVSNINANGGDSLKVIACDAAAAEMQSVRSFSNLIGLGGGGGTDMRVGMEAAAALRPKVDLVVVFTDGETPWPDEAPRLNPRAKYVAVLLAGDTGEDGPYSVPSWMHKIVVDDAYLSGERY